MKKIELKAESKTESTSKPKTFKTKSKIISLVTSAVMACSVFASYPVLDKEVDAASDYVNYAKALQYSLYLYDANMCGNGVNENSDFTWRNDCHKNDSYTYQGVTHDVSGGYHDAGDHVKFGLPQAYSMAALGLGYYTFQDAFSQTGTAAHLKTITDYYADYAKRCTWLNGDSASCFVYTVGNGDADHGYWGAPESQGDRNNYIYAATAGGTGRDVVASAAGALAMNYLNFGNAEDLTYATALFNMAKGMSGNAAEGNTGFYSSTSADGWLYFASVALQKCGVNAQGGTDNIYAEWPFGWNNAEVGAHVLTNSLKPGNDLKYFDTKKDGSGYIFMDKWGSARLNVQLQFAGLAYDKLNGGSTYSEQARQQMDIIFGSSSVTAADGINKCLMVGYNDKSSKYPHHRASSGYGTGPQGQTPQAHVLVGALCGGPETGSGGYADTADNYVANEVAIDYNACFVGSLAGLYLKYGAGDQTVDASAGGAIPEVRGLYGGGGGQPTPTTTTTTAATTTTTTTADPNVPTTPTTTADPSIPTTTTTSTPGIATLPIDVPTSQYSIVKTNEAEDQDWGGTVKVYGKISGFTGRPDAADFTFKQNGNDLTTNWYGFNDDTTLEIQVNTDINDSYFEVYYQGEFIGNIAYGGGTAPEVTTPTTTTTTPVPTTTTTTGYTTTPPPVYTPPTTTTTTWYTTTPVPVYTPPTTTTSTGYTTTPVPVYTPPTTTTTTFYTTPVPVYTPPTTTTPPTAIPPIYTTPSGSTRTGDVDSNGSVELLDLVLLCKHVVGVNGAALSGQNLLNSDCNGNGNVESDADDAVKLAAFLVKNIDYLPYSGLE